MYIILHYNNPVCWEKFPDIYSCKVWCLHHGFARLKYINEEGDTIIEVSPNITFEKIG